MTNSFAQLGRWITVTDTDELPALDSSLNIASGNLSNQLVFNDETLDNLWNQMYIKAKKVILMCRWCGAGNVITAECCVKCGGPSPTEGMN